MTVVYIEPRKPESSAALIRKAAERFSGWRGLGGSAILMVAYDMYGKPFLPGADMHVSVSHSGEYFGCAVGEFPVGFDIERIRELPFEKIVRRFCHPEELEYIRYDPAGIKRRFFDIWTLKESYVKYMGKGLRIPLNSFSVVKNGRIKDEIEGIRMIISHGLPGYGIGLCVSLKERETMLCACAVKE